MERIKIQGSDFKRISEAVVIKSLVVGLITGPWLYEKNLRESLSKIHKSNRDKQKPS